MIDNAKAIVGALLITVAIAAVSVTGWSRRHPSLRADVAMIEASTNAGFSFACEQRQYPEGSNVAWFGTVIGSDAVPAFTMGLKSDGTVVWRKH